MRVSGRETTIPHPDEERINSDMKKEVPVVDKIKSPTRRSRRAKLLKKMTTPSEWWTIRWMCAVGILGSAFAAFRGEAYVAAALGIVGGFLLVSWMENAVENEQKTRNSETDKTPPPPRRWKGSLS